MCALQQGNQSFLITFIKALFEILKTSTLKAFSWLLNLIYFMDIFPLKVDFCAFCKPGILLKVLKSLGTAFPPISADCHLREVTVSFTMSFYLFLCLCFRWSIYADE